MLIAIKKNTKYENYTKSYIRIKCNLPREEKKINKNNN